MLIFPQHVIIQWCYQINSVISNLLLHISLQGMKINTEIVTGKESL